MPEEKPAAGGNESFGSAANLMIEALEKASSELERTVNQCINQLNIFTDGLNKSLSLQLEKLVAQSSHLVDTHGGDLEAKRDETRTKRIATMLQWLASGKSRNWKYES